MIFQVQAHLPLQVFPQLGMLNDQLHHYLLKRCVLHLMHQVDEKTHGNLYCCFFGKLQLISDL